MKFSVITSNYNGALYLEQTIQSVLQQREDINLEYIVVDGGSSDGSIEIINKYADQITHCVIEEDSGPANAINKGLRLATGDIVSWLNSDDLYYPGTLARVAQSMNSNPENTMFYGSCKIVDESGIEIRSVISKFKELFFPVSCRFTYQCINYLSQPALFFRSTAVEKAGLLREDMVAAWDYDFVLRLWHVGAAGRVTGDPLAAFRWHQNSISGQNFRVQFEEEYTVAKADAGPLSLQACIHFLVRWGIVGAYSIMSRQR